MRRSRFEFCVIAALLSFLPATSLAVGPDKFSCPAGTKVEKRPHASKPIKLEYCRDPKTGFREGPYREIAGTGLVAAEGSYRGNKIDGDYRVFDEAGRLTQVIQFSNGEFVSSRLTRIGLENSFRKVNDRLIKEGKKTRVAVIDEGTVEYVITTEVRLDQPEHEEAARRLLLKDENFCNMIGIDGNLQTIIVRYVDEQRTPLLVVPIRRADCAK